MTIEESKRQLADPELSVQLLEQILREQPTLAPQIAAHRNLDDHLARKLAALHNPQVDAVLAWRPGGGAGLDRAVPGSDIRYLGDTEMGDPVNSAGMSKVRRKRGRLALMAGVAVVALAVGGVIATHHTDHKTSFIQLQLDDYRVQAYPSMPTKQWAISKADLLSVAQNAEPRLGDAQAIETAVVDNSSYTSGHYVASVVEGVSDEGALVAAVVTSSFDTGKILWAQKLPGVDEADYSDATYSGWSCMATNDIVNCSGGSMVDDLSQELYYVGATGAVTQFDTHMIGTSHGLTLALDHIKGQAKATVTATSAGKTVWTTQISPSAVELSAVNYSMKHASEDSLVNTTSVPGDQDSVVIEFLHKNHCTGVAPDQGCEARQDASAIVLDMTSGQVTGTLPQSPLARLGDDWVLQTPSDPATAEDGTTDGAAASAASMEVVVMKLDGTRVAQEKMPEMARLYVYGDLLIGAAGGRIYAYRKGQYQAAAWSRLVTNSFVDAVTAAGGVIIASGIIDPNSDSQEVRTMGIDPQDGAELWETDGEVLGSDTTRLFLAIDHERTITAVDPKDMREIWLFSNKKPVRHLGGSLVTNDGAGGLTRLH